MEGTMMMSATKIQQLTASDIMTRDPLTVSPTDMLRDALQLMVDNHVTGLPVVDKAGHCLGVISASDILSYEHEHADEAEDVNADKARYFDHERNRWESLRASTFALEHFGHIPVGELMSSQVVSIPSDAPVGDVARLMIDQEVHRVMVISDSQYLLGTISAIDIVQLVADETLPS
jgi:CBS domain-containing protein